VDLEGVIITLQGRAKITKVLHTMEHLMFHKIVLVISKMVITLMQVVQLVTILSLAHLTNVGHCP